ncbi:ABC-2 type transport system ATP-binding protein [Saccharopolyspora erythraea NRRL 2338]|uniref:ABC transporter ATP-binding protein n=2 Tax=Saccharopolyspora erythraea TaxID=1836 RepID=A0ABP3MGU5_SACER|nr:ABC transporter ATP-binding protein [Saccharopolyspora erythraea]EQD87615.1 ABC transporter [Saccharopolyspora erythraea D]PFG95021.1 ABC-2 type transport system ATP-binding protein [Saccharopolyspora erythraea NRRL 2338]QRK91710.1 ABC transporter ATP-binding protein [Saccharopolyspora erythraea]CAM01239.1 probable ABC transporter system, ATP-binding protein [Saccharopolyspora erythraea NRRL 2338]
MVEEDAGILAREVRRRFGSVEAVRGMDLTVPHGEVTALVGPNGAGKTTLLLMLATLLAPDSGELRIAGLDPVADPDAVRSRIGWMPDTFGVYDQLMTHEYLGFFCEAYRVPASAARERVAELLDLVHLAEFASQPVHVLSRGQKQRLGVARALVHRPSVLLLDEPASGLDPRSRVELRDLLRAQAREGTAVLVSSHILTELEEIADRVVFVDRGTTVSEHRMADLGSHRSTWRIRALDGDLTGALRSRGLSPGEATPAGVDVELESEQAAADLLRDLLADEVRVVGFGPAGNHLESAYLAFTEDRR